MLAINLWVLFDVLQGRTLCWEWSFWKTDLLIGPIPRAHSFTFIEKIRMMTSCVQSILLLVNFLNCSIITTNIFGHSWDSNWSLNAAMVKKSTMLLKKVKNIIIWYEESVRKQKYTTINFSIICDSPLTKYCTTPHYITLQCVSLQFSTTQRLVHWALET